MDALLKHIDQQIDYNKGKNLFHSQGKNLFQFIPETVSVAKQLSNLVEEEENLLLEYISNKAIEEFCRINQYYYFNSSAKEKLKSIYSNLLYTLKEGKIPHDLSEIHFEKLKKWLSETNQFSEKLYDNETQNLKCVVCSEYSPELQIDLMNIDLSAIMEPVLDIGCGKNGALVLYLRELGIEAFGIDRLTEDSAYLQQSDWFTYAFKTKHWGTIISNLGFSNHFRHHHLRSDGNYLAYAKKYMEILKSLKSGGSFYYSPGLNFIEGYLNRAEYKIITHSVENTSYNTTRIIRID